MNEMKSIEKPTKQTIGKGKGIFIGDKLLHLMKLKKISQRKLAKDLNLSHTAIYKYVHNKAGASFDVIKLLADYFNVPISYFFEDETSEESINKELYVLFDDLTELLQKLPPEKRRKTIQTFKEQLELMAV